MEGSLAAAYGDQKFGVQGFKFQTPKPLLTPSVLALYGALPVNRRYRACGLTPTSVKH